MKKLLTLFTILFSLTARPQSPGLNIKLRMDPDKARSTRYRISMKICEPRKMTDRGSLFARDTSSINFNALKPADINCGDYFDNGQPTIISAEPADLPFNEFEFSGQVFVWEKILVFRISDTTSKTRRPDMYIVIPMKYKSFRTFIVLKDLVFQPGRVMFLSDLKGRYDDVRLSFRRSLKKITGTDTRNFPLRAALEAN